MSDEAEANRCGCHADGERAARDPAYRRALWVVVGLNIGFGLAEIVGGFLANSQALKADALDFLGDGSITFVGLLALDWAKRTRARVALTQGWFLAVLGIGVIAMAVWRAMNAILPEADLMGGIGVAALGVNIIAALALSPFRGPGRCQRASDLVVQPQRCARQRCADYSGWSCGLVQQWLAGFGCGHGHCRFVPAFGMENCLRCTG